MSKGSDWAERRRKEMLDRVTSKRIVYLAATGTMVDMADRIWGDGGLTNGGKLTYKDNYDLYGYKPPLPKAPSGKGKTGKPIKGGYYVNYSALKEQQGRTDLPFELTGDLRQAWFGGVTPTPRIVGPLTCTITLPRKEYEKAEGLAKLKGVFLKMNAKERDGYIRRSKELLAR